MTVSTAVQPSPSKMLAQSLHRDGAPSHVDGAQERDVAMFVAMLGRTACGAWREAERKDELAAAGA
jgi:hypothetical protein